VSVLRWTGAETCCDVAWDAVQGAAGPGWDRLCALCGALPC
jgi:hypothetical protein